MRSSSLVATLMCAGMMVLSSASAPLNADTAQPSIAALPILTAATAKHFGMFQTIALSPDHRLVAYTVCDDRKQLAPASRRGGKASLFVAGCNVQLLDIATGATRDLTQNGDNGFPTWSPDGRYLAFFSDASGENHLYVWDREKPAASQVSDARISPFSPLEWTPDGKHIIVLSARATQAVTAPSSNILSAGPIVSGAKVVVYRSEEDLSRSEIAANGHITTSSPLTSLDASRGNLDAISFPAGTVRTIAANIVDFGSPAIAPDGSALAYTNAAGFASDNSATLLIDVAVADLDSFTSHVVAQNQRTGLSSTLAWSPQSRVLAWLGGPASDTQVSTYDRTTGKVTSASLPTVPGSFFEVTYESRLSWNEDGTAYYLLGSYGRKGSRASSDNAIWTGSPGATTIAKYLSIPNHAFVQLYAGPPHSGSILAQTTNLNTWNSGFYSINVATRQFRQVDEKQSKIDGVVETPDKEDIAYYRESADKSPDIWMADTAFHSERRVTHINPDFDRYVFGKAQMISWKTAAGQLLHGALLLPSDYQAGRRYPMIVYPYGSSYKSHEINNWGFGEDDANTEDLQTLATRGYAILLPDAPVHTGTPMRDIALTIMPGVDKAIAMGIADPQRLGVMGHSYGGYTVMALIVQTHRFKAAISRAGFSDWTAIYSELMPDGTAYGLIQADGNQYGLGGGPWTVLNKFISNSPYYLFNKVTTPVLIVQGTADSAVAPYNADISFVALRHLHKDVEYAKYAGGDHTEDSWPFDDQLDYMTRMVNWFDKYLCPNRPSATRCD